ncbi:hypothetical protein AB2505_21775, partial [Klebsiella pneumoniae]
MVGRKMFAQVEREEWNQWRSVSEEISAGLRDVIGNTPVGMVAQDIVYRQIRYMKSLPLEAAGRVREIQERAIQVLWSSFFGHADQMVGLCTGGQLGGRA